MKGFLSRIQKKLDLTIKENQFRELRVKENNAIDFTSNDYLGLAKSKALSSLIKDRIENLCAPNGSTGSRLLSGNSNLFMETEVFLSKIFNSESILICNSGYAANTAVLSSIPQRGDTIIYDELSHASIKDGARLSLANRISFRHNDLEDLTSKLERSSGNKFIVVESIYSMDGDLTPLEDLVTIAKAFDAAIILDEAHSTGVIGQNGSGIATSLNLENDIDIRIFTFGKAMGVHGACIAAPRSVYNYILNYSRPFIYTTALSPHSIVSIACAFEFLSANLDLQKKLNDRINFFKNKSQFTTKSKSAIQPICIPGNEAVRNIATLLQQQGLDVRPILSPTVKEGGERLRICLHTHNTFEEIEKLLEAITPMLEQISNFRP